MSECVGSLLRFELLPRGSSEVTPQVGCFVVPGCGIINAHELKHVRVILEGLLYSLARVI
jgi:hypothetical protein